MNAIFLADLLNPNVSISVDPSGVVVAFAGIVAMVYDSFFPNQRR